MAKFLDELGFSYAWNKIKQYTNDNVPRGPAGPDGTPIGTIISYMGSTAPQDYLICDGTTYNIATYPELARFFKTQFGTSNHFGGDGTTTFAVPDFRNLFLRGYHGSATEQLSGEIGVKQEGTDIPAYGVGASGLVNFTADDSTSATWPTNIDKAVGTAPIGRYVDPSVMQSWSTTLAGWPKTYTTRPVNAAVSYCIKAVTSVPVENAYSTEETRIGTWIDGKPIYRRVFSGTTISSDSENTILGTISDISSLVNITGIIVDTYGTLIKLPAYTIESGWTWIDKTGLVYVWTKLSNWHNRPVIVIVEYTKTTD